MVAAEPTVQEYVYASQLAYEDNPLARLGTLAGYEFVAKPSLGDGFQALVLKRKAPANAAPNAPADMMIAFRGTLPDVQGTLDRTKTVLGDALAMSGSGEMGMSPQQAALQQQIFKQMQADQAKLAQAPLIQDLLADIDIFNGRPAQQIADAVNLVLNYTRGAAAGQIYVTGHSLGGGLANAVASAIPTVAGRTFAAPGDRLFKNSAGARLVNYINRNDPVGMVNVGYHVGRCEFLDTQHTSFDIEHQLDLPAAKIFGFNGVLDTDKALSAQNAATLSIISASLGFLIARLATYHPMENYAALVKCKPLDPTKTHPPATLQDLAKAARFYIAAALGANFGGSPVMASMPYVAPVVVPFTLRVVRRSGQIFVDVMTAYGKAEIQAAPYGLGMVP